MSEEQIIKKMLGGVFQEVYRKFTRDGERARGTLIMRGSRYQLRSVTFRATVVLYRTGYLIGSKAEVEMAPQSAPFSLLLQERGAEWDMLNSYNALGEGKKAEFYTEKSLDVLEAEALRMIRVGADVTFGRESQP